MERVIGSNGITKIKDGYLLRLGAVAIQKDEEQLKDILYLLADVLDFVVVDDVDMKKLIMTIDENNTIPLRETSNNNVFTREKISTEDLLELNKKLHTTI